MDVRRQCKVCLTMTRQSNPTEGCCDGCAENPRMLHGYIADIEAQLAIMKSDLHEAGDGDTWRAACLRVTAELDITRQRLSQAETLLERSKIAALEADSDFSAYASGRPLDKHAASRTSWMCRNLYSDIVQWLLGHSGDVTEMMEEVNDA